MIAPTTDRRMIRPELEQRVRELLAQGLSYAEIQRRTKLAKATITSIKFNRRKPRYVKPKPITDAEAALIALDGGRRYRDSLQRTTQRDCSDNLISSLRYVWRGILAESAGLYVPPEERSPPS